MTRPKSIAITSDLVSFFTDEIDSISGRQGIKLSEHTVIYMGEMLARFNKSENYFVNASDPNERKKEFPTISLLWLEGLTAEFREKIQTMKKVGDLALMTSGFFPERLQKRLVDLDYYTAIGGRAYETAGQLRDSVLSERALNCFFELAQKFSELTEVLRELNDQQLLVTEQDQLKLYEKWLGTQNPRIRRMLSENGILVSDPTKAKS
jgi:hypothetical protein